MRLGVNIDHVATLRNARKGAYPELLRAAKIVDSCGCHGVTMHLREDRRHILDDDLWVIKNESNVKINLEIAATDEMVDIALDLLPNAVCFVPENREELTTEGGLNLILSYNKLLSKVNLLQAQGIKVTLFLDPDLNQIKKAVNMGVDAVELHVGSYANAENQEIQRSLLEEIKKSAIYLKSHGIEVHAGHGLDYNNIAPIRDVDEIEEVNIGHFLIAESMFIGLEKAIKKMQRLLLREFLLINNF